ncbi:hypothetical protein PS645_01381 [Pseudomonas fluorescens]|uniref:Uncharacterized protein n=1 Tax=Pseudomonas fluorescens TaxID=294 RepID=A0A5E6R448_PSEFL|nr:hypothetical protein [Pseudomonas fluorescens]VVM63319.1 hypothetical protein PS645_01381 [Pseudomonas fluorescens]
MTTAKIRRMLQVMRDRLKPSELLIITIPPDSQAPVTHWTVSLDLAGRYKNIAMACNASMAAEIAQHLHDLDRSTQRMAVMFPEHSEPKSDFYITPAIGATAEQLAREALRGTRRQHDRKPAAFRPGLQDR